MTPDEASHGSRSPERCYRPGRILPEDISRCQSAMHVTCPLSRRFLTIFSTDRILGRFRPAVLDRLTCWNALLCAIVMRPWNLWRAAAPFSRMGPHRPGRRAWSGTCRRRSCACRDTRVHHRSSRLGTGKGDRLCRSERINRSGSSASANLASWPAWPIAAAAPCWPGDGARDVMHSPSRKRTSSRRIARRFAFASDQSGTPAGNR